MSTDEFQKGFDDFKFDFVADQKTELPTASAYKEHIEGGTFIVTGSNTGLGLYAAQALVATGAAKVILAVRSQAKGDEAVAKIEAETGIKGVADVWTLEMGSYKSIEAFGKKVQSLDRLDGISENAAVAHDKFSTAEIPAETSIAVNVLGTMALAGLVFPKLQKTAKKYGKTTHLSIVGSGVAFQTDAREELEAADKSGKDIIDFFNEDNREFTARYPLTKLLLLHAIRAYSIENPVSKTGVVVNFVNPGLCITELDRNVAEESQKALKVFRDQIGRTAEVGSRTLIHGLVGGEETHGTYTSENVQKNHYVPNFITGEDGRRLEKIVWDSIKKHVNAGIPGAL